MAGTDGQVKTTICTTYAKGVTNIGTYVVASIGMVQTVSSQIVKKISNILLIKSHTSEGESLSKTSDRRGSDLVHTLKISDCSFIIRLGLNRTQQIIFSNGE